MLAKKAKKWFFRWECGITQTLCRFFFPIVNASSFSPRSAFTRPNYVTVQRRVHNASIVIRVELAQLLVRSWLDNNRPIKRNCRMEPKDFRKKKKKATIRMANRCVDNGRSRPPPPLCVLVMEAT